jgi:outer membrane protein assembly factor BamB
MTRFAIYLLFPLLFAGCNNSGSRSEASVSWPSFRGSGSLQGYAAVDIPSEPQLLWTVEHKVRTVSSPVVLGGTAYWCDRRGKITGTGADGQPVFEYDFATAVEAPLMAYDSVLYVARIDGTLSALSLRTREILWEYETEGQLSGSANIIQEGDRRYILFGSYDYCLYCLDAATGALISRFESNYYINGAVALSGRFAVFGGCDALVRKVDVLEGVMTDSLQLEAYVPASPAVDGNTAYIGDYNGTIYAIGLDALKVDTLYRSGKGEDNAFLSTPAVDHGQIVFYGSDKHLRMMTARGAELWKFLIGDTGESSPVLTRKHVLACSRSGVVYLLDRKTGFLQWRYDTGEQIAASPAVISGRFYILTAKGTLFCFGEK